MSEKPSTVRLTPARLEALSNVDQGVVTYMSRGSGSPARWLHASYWQALRPQPYEWLLHNGLIELGRWSSGRPRPVTLTAQGRTVLAAHTEARS